MTAKTFYHSLFTLLVLSSCDSARGEAKQPRVNLAGTFNNWATGLSEYQMEPRGSEYTLQQFFPCGSHKFKFVFDGSWDRHLGSAGEDRLEQPGRDIELNIMQSAEYDVRLNPAAKKWSLQRATTPQHPHAVFSIHHDHRKNYYLDASPSVLVDDRPITKQDWRITNPEGRELDHDVRLGGVRFSTDMRGPHQIFLTISDGVETSSTTRIIQLNQNSAADDAQEFAFEPSGFGKDFRIESVDLVGDFNNWRAGVHPMFSAPGKQLYKCRLSLPDGIHHYKFLINGCIFRNDPKADSALSEPDGLGGLNSGVRVGPDASKLGPAPQDAVLCSAIKHDPAHSAFFIPIGRELATLRLRTLADDVQRTAAIVDGLGDPVPLRLAENHSGFDYWTANCHLSDSRWRYWFELRDGRSTTVLDRSACREMTRPKEIAGNVKHFEVSMQMSFETPDWAKRAVWYQIFPERFRNGDPSNDPPRTVPWTHIWEKPYTGGNDPKSRKQNPEFSERGGFFEFIFDRRYGGDLQGVREKLPYLRDLGITAIYFNPIFLAESLHKYDASDYRHIDDFFGVKDSLQEISGETTDPKTWQWSKSDLLFLDFLKEAHRLGFKVVLDGVFNHTGRDFWAFQDLLRNGEKSAYVDWFDIKSFKPFHYRAWDKDDGALPRLKHDDALGLSVPVREHIFAVTRRWMDPDGDGNPADGIDGWRLDVAGDININFWKDWRKLVKSINPDAYIVAELWQESREWLDGRSFDAVMNYPFAVRCQRFFVNDRKAIKPSEFDRQIKEILAWYEPQVNYVLQNLFGSHDTDRAASMFMNPDLEYDQANRLQDNGPNYVTARPTRLCYDKFKLMVTFQMTYLGAPMIYYGDEVGMYGADDPSDRKPMFWEDLPPNDDPDERIVPDVFEHHRRMIAIRNSFPALQLGAMHTVMTDDAKGIYAFSRSLNDECVVVLINNSPRAHHVDLKSPWPDGTKVARLDDPKAALVVLPSGAPPDARARIRSAPGSEFLKADGGLVRRIALAPYTAAVLAPPPGPESPGRE